MAMQEEEQLLMMMQMLTQKIHYVVHTEDNENHIEITLKTDSLEAAQLLPPLREGIVTNVTQMLYQMFAMNGERV